MSSTPLCSWFVHIFHNDFHNTQNQTSELGCSDTFHVDTILGPSLGDSICYCSF